MGDAVLIYGATGYTGRLIAERAVAEGLRPVLSGRNGHKLAALADRFGLTFRCAALDDAPGLRAALRGARLVLNAAGPFTATLEPLADACLQAGVHYLDVTGEIAAIERAAARDDRARRLRTMIMPAVGFDVVPSDCLAAGVVARCPGATRLRIGIAGLDLVSRGSLKTIFERIGQGVTVRRQGRLTALPHGDPEASRLFDFGRGPRPCLAVSWGDVSSAHFTTGVPDIVVYFEATVALRAAVGFDQAAGGLLRQPPWPALLERVAEAFPEGPSAAQRATRSATIVAEASDGQGLTVGARLRTPEVYGFTAASAVAVARRVLAGDLEIGFQTPARVYGPDFVLSLPGVTREEL